jgi:uncharacterized protein
MSIRRTFLLLALIVPSVRAQSAFVYVVRGDTIAIEKFTRTPTRLEADMVMKGGPRALSTSAISATGAIAELQLRLFAPGAPFDAGPMMTGRMRLEGDTAVGEMTQKGAAPQTQRFPSKAGAQPILNNSIAAFEALLQQARRAKTADASATVFLATGATTTDIKFTGILGDSASASIASSTMWFVSDSTGQVLRAGIPAQGLLVTRVRGIDVSKLRMASPDYSAPASAPYTAINVAVPTKFGHSLGGTFTKPKGDTTRLPVVISITGSGPQDRDEYIDIIPGGFRLFRQVADTLARRGIAMLRMDDRGYGESGGAFAAATSRDFANDIRAAITYLRSRNDVDSTKIFLIGHSEGGMIAPMVAAEERGLAGIVLMAGPGRNGRQILEFQVGAGVKRDTALTGAKRDSAIARVPVLVDSLLKTTAWLTFFGTHDPIATAKRVRTPVLILQGADDQQVVGAEAPLLRNAFTAGGNRDVTMRVFPELNHFFIRQPGGNPAGYTTLSTNLVSSDVLGVAVDWIAQRAQRTTRVRKPTM